MITRQTFVDKTREYINVPVVHAGRNRLGVDCVGLFICVAHDLDLFDYDNVNYSPHVVPEEFIKELEKFATKKDEFATYEIADMIVFNVGKWPHHVGMISNIDRNGDVWFIHTDMIVKRVVETRIDLGWERRINSLYKPKGIK